MLLKAKNKNLEFPTTLYRKWIGVKTYPVIVGNSRRKLMFSICENYIFFVVFVYHFQA